MAVTRGKTRYGAFYYPWFTSGDTTNGHPTSADAYPPTLGNPYDSSATSTMRQHALWALQAHVDTFICSDWGKGNAFRTYENTTKFLRYLESGSNPNPYLKLAVYYELEQNPGGPTPAAIKAHLDNLRADMFTFPTYRHIDGVPVVFVYDPQFDSSAWNRWTSARALYEADYPGETVYLNFHIWHRGGPPATDSYTTAFALGLPNISFHKYGVVDQGSATEQYAHIQAAETGHSFTVSPGFSNPPPSPTTRVMARSTSGFAVGIASGMSYHDAMAVSNEGLDWILVNSFNELGEGSNVEPSTGFGVTTAEQTTYLDIMASLFPFPSTGTYPSFQISTVSSTTLYHEISDYVREFSGMEVAAEVLESDLFGSEWIEQKPTGHRVVGAIKLSGFYDDTSDNHLMRLQAGEVGSSVYLRSVFAVNDVVESRVVVKRFSDIAQVNAMTMYEAEFMPTGALATSPA